MKNIFIIVKKEFWELKYSLKRLAMLGFVFLLPFFAYKSEGSEFIKTSSIPGFVIILAAIGCISHLTAESILSEKKDKTMELLLSTRLSPLSLVVGKIIPGFIIGSFLAFIILIILVIINMMNLNDLSLILIVNFLLFTFASGLITYIITLFIPDEKVYSLIAIFVLLLIIGLLKLLVVLNLSLYFLITTPVLLAINIILSLCAKRLLLKSRLFLKI
jgi:ABC-type Na+ efflux pump permease subunit